MIDGGGNGNEATQIHVASLPYRLRKEPNANNAMLQNLKQPDLWCNKPSPWATIRLVLGYIFVTPSFNEGYGGAP